MPWTCTHCLVVIRHIRIITIAIPVLCAVLISGRTVSGAGMPAAVDTTAFIGEACIRYDTSFTVGVRPMVWEAVIERPLLLGMIWGAYGFEPPYTLAGDESAVHVTDGSGLDGYLYSAGGDLTTRIVLASGRLRNWGLPIGVKGRALFILRWEPHETSVDIRLAIYGEGTGSAADVIITAFSPILRYFINRRIGANLRDFSVILDDIAHHPEVVREKLGITHRPAFDSLRDAIATLNQ